MSDLLCLRMWRILWIGNIAQTLLRCVSHSPLGRWLCIPPRIVFVPLIKAHCYLHDNPVRAAFCFGALHNYLFHTPVQPRQSAEAGGQEDGSCDAHGEAEETQEETDRAPTLSVAGLIGEAFDSSKRYFEISVDLADYAGDLLMHKLGFKISRKNNVTFKEIHTRYLELGEKYYQRMNELNETIAQLTTVEDERVREKQEYSEALVQLITVEKERKRETHEYSETLVKLTTTQKRCIAALEERNALREANQELRTDFEDVSRRLKELEQKQLEEPAGAWGKHLNWVPSRAPKSKLEPAGKKERG